MIVVMNAGATQENIDHVIAKIEQAGLRTHLSKGEDRVIIGVIGDKQLISRLEMNMMEGVEKTVRITEKYKLVSREFHPESSIVYVSGFPMTPRSKSRRRGHSSCAAERSNRVRARTTFRGLARRG